MKIIFLLVIFNAFFLIAVIGSDPIKEFGPSVTFAEGGPAIKINGLKGKVVVIVFFQSWCPICNGWSGQKFKKVEEAFAKDRSVVLVALKTDGGGTTGAKTYLKDRVNLENWVVGADKNAEYYKEVNGKDELYHYAIVNGRGELVEKGYFGSDDLSQKNFSNGFFTKNLLPKDAKYPDKLLTAVKEAELGLYKESIIECRKIAKLKEFEDESKKLEKDIFASLQDRINDLSEHLKVEDDPKRFSYYLELRHFIESLQGMTIQNGAINVMAEYKNNPAIKKELNAEVAYNTYKKNLEILRKSDIPKYKETFIPKFLEMYKNTYYASIVQNEEKK